MCSSKQSTIVGPIEDWILLREMLSLMVFIVGHCRYSSFLTIWLVGVASGMSGKVLLNLPLTHGGQGSTACSQPHFVLLYFASWYPDTLKEMQLNGVMLFHTKHDSCWKNGWGVHDYSLQW